MFFCNQSTYSLIAKISIEPLLLKIKGPTTDKTKDNKAAIVLFYKLIFIALFRGFNYMITYQLEKEEMKLWREERERNKWILAKKVYLRIRAIKSDSNLES